MSSFGFPKQRTWRHWDTRILNPRTQKTRCALNIEFGRTDAARMAELFIPVNWSGFTAIDVNKTYPGALYVEHPNGATSTLKALMLPIFSGDWEVVLELSCMNYNSGEVSGIILADGVTAGAGNQQVLAWSRNNNHHVYACYRYTNYGTLSSTVRNVSLVFAPRAFLRLKRSGSTYTQSISTDGRLWSFETSVAPGWTPTHIGLCFQIGLGANIPVHYAFHSFRVFWPTMPADAIGGWVTYPDLP